MARFSYKKKDKEIKLDQHDKKILTALSEDSRATITSISKRARLNRDTTAYRINRLEKTGIIMKFHADINYGLLGLTVCQTFLLVDERDKEAKNEVIRNLKNDPHTISLIEYSDTWDYQWKVVVKSVHDFDKLLSTTLKDSKKVIIERAAQVALGIFGSTQLPWSQGTDRKPYTKITKQPDEKDFKIMRLLSKDSRLSTYNIGEAVGLSADAVRIRINKLKETGIIKRFTILIDFSKIGQLWFTFLMRVSSDDESQDRKLRTFIKSHPNIVKAMKTLGPWDYMIYIIASEPKNFHSTVKEIKTTFADTIRSYETLVAYDEILFEPFPNALMEL